jgi:formamidopyrimidine-DNA glycosylase
MSEIKDIYDVVTDALAKIKTLKDKTVMSGVYDDLVRIQEQVITMKSDYLKLQEENSDLKKQLQNHLNLEAVDSKTNWTDGGVGVYEKVPGKKEYLCRHCFDQGKISHVTPNSKVSFYCPECKQYFELGSQEEVEEAVKEESDRLNSGHGNPMKW